jgi:hypothetical protein
MKIIGGTNIGKQYLVQQGNNTCFTNSGNNTCFQISKVARRSKNKKAVSKSIFT